MTDLNSCISDLQRALEESHFSTLDIHALSSTIFESANDIAFDMSAEIHKIGAGMATYFYRVELVGKRDEFRRLALILFTQALTSSNQYLAIRLRESETNALILAPVPHPLNFFQIQPLSLRYKRNFGPNQLWRFDVEVKDRDRPHIGFFEKEDPGMKINHTIPPWANQAVFIDGMANARVRLAASILDYAHPDSTGDFKVERTWEQVGSLSYDLSICIED